METEVRAPIFRQENQVPLSKTDNTILTPEDLNKAQALEEDIMSAYPTVGTVEDAAALLSVPVTSVRAMCRQRAIEAIKVGQQWRIPRVALLSFIMEGGC